MKKLKKMFLFFREGVNKGRSERIESSTPQKLQNKEIPLVRLQ